MRRIGQIRVLSSAAVLSGCSLGLNFDLTSQGGGDSGVGSFDARIDAAVASAADGALPDTERVSESAFAHPFFTQSPAIDPERFACASLEPPATFCDDFETTPLKEHWTNPIQIPGSTAHISIDNQAARGGHGALLAELDDTAVADNFLGAYALEVFDDFEALPIRVTVDVDLRVERIDPGAGRYVALFEFNFGDILGDHSELFVRIESQGTRVQAYFVERDIIKLNYPLPGPDTEALFAYGLLPTPTVNTWTHLRFELDAVNPSGSGNLAKVTLGDQRLYEGPLHFALRGLQPRLGVGLPWPSTLKFKAEDPSRAWRVRYDNVLVRIAAR